MFPVEKQQCVIFLSIVNIFLSVFLFDVLLAFLFYVFYWSLERLYSELRRSHRAARGRAAMLMQHMNDSRS